MTNDNVDGVVAVGIFLVICWPFFRLMMKTQDQIFPSDGEALKPAGTYLRLNRIFVILVLLVLIGFSVRGLQLSKVDPKMEVGLHKFGLVLFSAMVLWHIYKIRAERYFTIDVPSHATITKANGFTYIAMPDEPPEPTVLDEPLVDFNVAALKELINQYACEIGPLHPEFFLNPQGDGRSFHTHIPGNWSELFWQSTANYLISDRWPEPTAPEDDDEHFYQSIQRQTAAAVLIALCYIYPEICDRTVKEAKDDPELEKFLADGYLHYLYYRNSIKVRALEALPAFAKEG